MEEKKNNNREQTQQEQNSLEKPKEELSVAEKVVLIIADKALPKALELIDKYAEKNAEETTKRYKMHYRTLTIRAIFNMVITGGAIYIVMDWTKENLTEDWPKAILLMVAIAAAMLNLGIVTLGYPLPKSFWDFLENLWKKVSK